MNIIKSSVLLLAIAAPVAAQQPLVVHYPDATLSNPPNLGFPFYTPGGGSAGLTVRYQVICPASWLAQQAPQAGFVSSIGFSIAGAGLYDQFVVRAGTSDQTSLQPDWSVNLPDQRVQVDLSGTIVRGGGTQQAPVNTWVDFPLRFPFYYEPGDAVVVDFITNIQYPGINTFLSTSVAYGVASRCYNFQYTPGAQATSFGGSGIKFRFNVEPLSMISFGAGCSSAGNTPPSLNALGTSQLGDTAILNASNTANTGLGLFIIGFSKAFSFGGAPLPLTLGGGCELLVRPDSLVPQVLQGSGAAYAVVIPNNPNLAGAVLFSQYAEYDVSSPAAIPYVLSNGGALPVY